MRIPKFYALLKYQPEMIHIFQRNGKGNLGRTFFRRVITSGKLNPRPLASVTTEIYTSVMLCIFLKFLGR